MEFQRMIEIPKGVPDSYIPIVMVFADTATKGNTQISMHASEEILVSLRGKAMADRMRIIKKICGNIETMLLQYSSDPGDVTVREI